MRFVFVGERRSNRAIAMGVTWVDGHLAAKTLHDGLRALNINPTHQRYINLFPDSGPDRPIRGVIRELKSSDIPIVAMGRLVQSHLERCSIPHRKMIHPAARGRIRKKELYIRHMQEVLCGINHEEIRQENAQP